jgi:hypothetical protein
MPNMDKRFRWYGTYWMHAQGVNQPVTLAIGNGYRTPLAWGPAVRQALQRSADHGRHVRSDMVSARGGAITRWRTTRPRLHMEQLDNKTPNPNMYVTPVQFPGTYMTTWAGTHVRRAGSTRFIVSCI